MSVGHLVQEIAFAHHNRLRPLARTNDDVRGTVRALIVRAGG